MKKLKHTVTGSVVIVSDETAVSLGYGWELIDDLSDAELHADESASAPQPESSKVEVPATTTETEKKTTTRRTSRRTLK